MKTDAIILRSASEIEKLRASNVIVAEVLGVLRGVVRPGASTMDLEKIAEEEIKRRGGTPAFKGYKGYPFCLCTSINEEVVHGMPSVKRVLKEGDIVSVDCGVLLGGFYGDAAFTAPVGQVSEEAARLIKITEESLEKGIEKALPGGRLHDISAAVQQHAEGAGFSIVRMFVGHGIGRNLHEAPQVPNFGVAGTGVRLKEGMVLAIEPMINAGGADVKVLSDGWTAVTVDGRLSAHFEHSVAITKDGPYVLSRL